MTAVFPPMRSLVPFALPAVSCFLLVACTCDDQDKEPVAAASASSAASPRAPTCKVASEKTWPGAPNSLVPLIASRLDETRVAVGLELTTFPAVLVFDDKGEGELVEPPLGDASRPPPETGRRELLRVTPALDGDRIIAYVDSRTTGEESRRVRCGRADSSEALLSFEGAPLLSKPGGGEPEMAPVARAQHKGAPAPSSSSEAPPALKALATSSSTGSRREVRDCRSFVDPDGKAWAVGTELVEERGASGIAEYRVELVVMPSAGAEPIVIHTVKLGTKPTHLPAFEAPFARKVADDRTLLAMRHQGGLLVWDLDADRKPRGPAHRYAGGYPTMTDIVPGDSGRAPLLLTSMRGMTKNFEIRFGRMTQELPRTLDPVDWGFDRASRTEPCYVRTEDFRFVSYAFGETRKHGLDLLPVDERMQPQGSPVTLAPGEESVARSRAVDLGGNRVLVVYTRTRGGRPELVSKIVACL